MLGCVTYTHTLPSALSCAPCVRLIWVLRVDCILTLSPIGGRLWPHRTHITHATFTVIFLYHSFYGGIVTKLCPILCPCSFSAVSRRVSSVACSIHMFSRHLYHCYSTACLYKLLNFVMYKIDVEWCLIILSTHIHIFMDPRLLWVSSVL